MRRATWVRHRTGVATADSPRRIASLFESRSGARRPEAGWRPYLYGFALALLVSGAWVGLTAWTGKTYHFAPLVGAMAPGLLVRWMTQRPLDRLGMFVAGGSGLVAIGLGWVAILVLDSEPHATLVEGLPGGVWFEVIVGGLLGAAIGAFGLSLFGRRTPGDARS